MIEVLDQLVLGPRAGPAVAPTYPVEGRGSRMSRSLDQATHLRDAVTTAGLVHGSCDWVLGGARVCLRRCRGRCWMPRPGRAGGLACRASARCTVHHLGHTPGDLRCCDHCQSELLGPAQQVPDRGSVPLRAASGRAFAQGLKLGCDLLPRAAGCRCLDANHQPDPPRTHA